MIIGFIGLGNVGRQLAASLLRNGFSLVVRDVDESAAGSLEEQGARLAESPKDLAASADMVITCPPSPSICAAVMEAEDGVLAGLRPGSAWLEMSTTDAEEVQRLGALVRARGGEALDCPVSGGCHRAATGNIAILAGGERSTFERALPLLTAMGRDVLHTGALGSASVLKVVTNYLASANLVSLGEALMVARQAGMDLATTYEAIRISSGNSFVHETESQVILNGSYNINFTMDLVIKDMSLFEAVASRAKVPLEISPKLLEIFRDGQERFGARAWSSMIVKRLEEACGADLRAPGFPPEMVDDQEEVPGAEIEVRRDRSLPGTDG